MLTWIKAILAALGIINKAEDMIHDHNVEVAGENKIIATDNAESAKAAQDAAQAIVDTTDHSVSDSLRHGSF